VNLDVTPVHCMSVSMMTEFVMALKTVGITPMKFIVIMLVSDCNICFNKNEYLIK
jgi:hypothetical protein